ncbi:MAG: D-alanine--D-alanine ligase, partial [Proteobacteria bacterium]|nr:D-alanine--D-alanine ligase [Pseudomonadota bacterium]
MTLDIAVLMGGDSAEASVSRASAKEVVGGLEAGGHRVTTIEISTTLPAALVEAAPEVVFPVLHGPPGEDGTVQGLLDMMN